MRSRLQEQPGSRLRDTASSVLTRNFIKTYFFGSLELQQTCCGIEQIQRGEEFVASIFLFS